MQSFLQYRRFGKHVRQQYERNQNKVAGSGLRAYGSDNSSPSSDLVSSPESKLREDPRDVEKAGQSGEVDFTPPEANTEAPIQVFGPNAIAQDLEKQNQGTGQAEPRLLPSQRSSQPGRERDEGEDGVGMSAAVTTTSRRSFGTNLGAAMTGINLRKRTTKEGGDHGNVFVVGYEGEDDSLNPHNWSRTTRIKATLIIAAIGWIVGFASSVDSGALDQAAKGLGVSQVAESLATGLFLIGFGCGGLFAGPISETVGRNPVYIATLIVYMIFIMASALSPNIGAQLAFRFIAGFFGATPLTCAGGSISDLWSPMERVYAFPIFANAAFMGPIFGPVVGGFIGASSLVSWRWTEWVTLIISGFIFALVVLFQPETYAPILLKWKAAHLREITGDDRYRSEVEIRKTTFLYRLIHALYRPFILTAREPVVILIALYLTVIYIILFTFLNGYTFVFTETYGFSQGITGLSFIGIGIGLCLASILVPFFHKQAKRDLAEIKAAGGSRLPPEFRLWFAMAGAPAIPISMFWMGWTDYPSISYWSPLAASVLFGYGILCVFISSYQYIIDSYEDVSASALASVTLIRYVAAGGMVEVAIPMYKKLGVHWTLTILGAISALLVPVPYLFYKYGTKIRARSRYAIKD